MAIKKTFVRQTTVVVTDSREQTVEVDVDGQRVGVPVSAEIKAYFNEHFKANTENQQKRRATLMNLMRAAYKKGLQDGRK